MNTANVESVVLRGVGISTGKVCGPLRVFRRNTDSPAAPRASAGEEAERERLNRALEKTREQLSVLQHRARSGAGEKEAEIFEIHAMLLEDEDFLGVLHEKLSGNCTAEQAVEQASEHYANMLKALNDEYLSARAADIRDIAGQILRALGGSEENTAGQEAHPHILVADDLTPSETVLLDQSQILGFVTFAGTPNSHTAILARAMGIPALVGVGEPSLSLDGKTAILDAAAGTLTVSPPEDQLEAFRQQQEENSRNAAEHERYLRSLIDKPAVTRSGHKIMIYANVGDERDVPPALLNGADGIGLLRSEFLYLSLDRYPTEDELFEAYKKVILQMQGKRVIIRTLDIGADKKISYFDLPDEENPALGFRAVRICLAREELFRTQLRAILRASAFGSVSLMIPMIVSVDEVRECQKLLEICQTELTNEGIQFDPHMEFGIMVETPAAAVMSAELATEVDFFSVGTNDLTQYTLAADRQNPLLADLCKKNNEPVLRLIRMAADAIHAHGGWIGICGEIAADLQLTQRFADMGIDELSVSAPYLLGLREKVNTCN